MLPHRRLVIALAVTLALLALLPATGVAATADVQVESTQTNATTGQQLSTVIEVTDEEVRHEAERSALEAELDADDETERAAAIAARTVELQERSESVHADYRDATQGFEDGELSRVEYAQRLAVLHARANGVQDSLDRVEAAAAETSQLELESAGYDQFAIDETRERLRSVTGSGVGALLAQFTGEARGEFTLEVEDGLEIEVESEDGELSREFEREEPEHGLFEIDHAAARSSAQSSLGSPDDDGRWVLEESERDDDGYFEFEFAYVGDATTGEAEVGVDARSGAVFALDEELEPVDDDRDGDLAIDVVGEPAPGVTVTITVTDASGSSQSGASVRVNDALVGETDANGEIEIALPQTDEVSVDVEAGEAEGEREFEFAEDEAERLDDRAANLDVRGYVEDGTATLQATFDGDAVSDAAVYVEGDYVATTDGSGEAQFAAPEDDEFDATLVRGHLVTELELAVDAGDLVVLELEFEDERHEEREDGDDERDHEDGSLDVAVVDGDLAPGATVTIGVTDSAGDPVVDATVEVEDDLVGTTDADGQIVLTLPDSVEDVEIEVEHDHGDGELEIEFGDESSATEDDEDADEDDDDDVDDDDNEVDDEGAADE